MRVVDPPERAKRLHSGQGDVLVYTARCLTNDRVYVGITSRPFNARVQKHLTRARMGADTVFATALREVGFSNFSWTAVAHGFTWKEACALEEILIEDLDSRNPARGYNMAKGFVGTLSLRTRKRLAVAGRCRTLSEASRQKLRASKMRYAEAFIAEAVGFAMQHSFYAAEKHFGVPRVTIHRWARTPQQQDVAREAARKLHRKRQYGRAFPVVRLPKQTPNPDEHPDPR